MKYRIWKSMKPFFSKMMRFRESEQGIFFQKKLQRISFYLEKLIKLSDVGVRSSELLDYHSIYASGIFWNLKYSSNHSFYLKVPRVQNGKITK